MPSIFCQQYGRTIHANISYFVDYGQEKDHRTKMNDRFLQQLIFILLVHGEWDGMIADQ